MEIVQQSYEAIAPLVGMGIAAGISALGKIWDNARDKKLRKKQMEQDKQQTAWLNEQQLGMLRNSPKAQKEGYVKAGLNPGLAYGISGAGGTSGAAGVQHVESQQTQKNSLAQDTMMGLQMATIRAEARKLDAEAEGQEIENANESEGGVNYENTKANTDLTKKNTTLAGIEADIQQVAKSVAQKTQGEAAEQIKENLRLTQAAVNAAETGAYVDRKTAEYKITVAKAESIGAYLKNDEVRELIKTHQKGRELTDKQIDKIGWDIANDRTYRGMEWEVDQQNANTRTAELAQKIAEENNVPIEQAQRIVEMMMLKEALKGGSGKPATGAYPGAGAPAGQNTRPATPDRKKWQQRHPGEHRGMDIRKGRH